MSIKKKLVREALKIACEDGSIYGSADTPAQMSKVNAEIEEIERKLNHT